MGSKIFQNNTIKICFASFFLSALLSGCRDKFNPVATYKDTPVVYCVLNVSDTSHFVKVSKVFSPKGNANESAQISDSLYYKNVDVFLESWKNGQASEIIPLSVTTEIPKESGIFSNNPNILFKTSHTISSDNSYKLNINFPDNGKTVWSTIPMITGITSFTPNYGYFGGLSFSFNRNESIQWTSVPVAKMYDVTIRFNYSEYSGTDTVKKYVDWGQGITKSSSTSGGERLSVTFKSSDFYFFLSQNIPIGQNVKRIPGKIDFLFALADENISRYIESNAQLSPYNDVVPYSNINNGIGLFACRYNQSFTGYSLSSTSLDSLCNGQYTSGLNFIK